MKKQPNPKVFMGLTALTLMGAVGAAMFQYSSLQDTQNLVSKLRKDSLDETTLENQLKSSEAQLKQCGARLNHLEKGVPALEYVPTMLKELESIGKDNGLEILGIRPVPKVVAPKDSKDKKSGNKYAELDIEVTSRGSFGGLQKFMHALQSLQGFQIDAVITHGEIRAFDERVTQITGEQDMLEISFVVGTRGQKRDHRRLAVGRRQGRQLLL